MRYSRPLLARYLPRPARQLLLAGSQILARLAARRYRRPQTAQPDLGRRSGQRRRAVDARPPRLHRRAACRWSTACWASWPGSGATSRRASAPWSTSRRTATPNRVDAADLSLGALPARGAAAAGHPARRRPDPPLPAQPAAALRAGADVTATRARAPKPPPSCAGSRR